MSQCSAEKCRASISVKSAVLLLFCLALPACTMEGLEKFAREKEADHTATAPGTGAVTAINLASPLIPEFVIKGGKQKLEGAMGGFARLLIGPADEVRFIRPVAVGGYDNILYIVDAGAKLIFKYDLDTKIISSVGEVGIRFVGEPGNIHVLRDHSFYAVDSTGKRVLHFDKNGELLNTLSDPSNLSRPMDVWADERTGEVYVADGSFSHIVVFDKFGKSIKAIGRRGTGPGRFRAITDMTFGIDGLYVLDRLELPIQVLGLAGEFLYSFGEQKQIYPTSIAVDQWKRVYVSDKSDNTIRVYENRELIAEIGGGGATPGRFRLITNMWVKDRYLYVADSQNRRIQVMRINPEYSGTFVPLGL